MRTVAFEGIPLAAVDFYEELELNNSREWWAAHRAVYEEQVRAPLTALGELLEAEFGAAKVYRPQRDLRFSPDKSPYKTHQGIVVATAQHIGWYVQVDANGLLTAGGWWAGEPATLARYRRAVDGARTGGALDRTLVALREAGYAVGGEQLRTRPRGVAPDHPRLHLLRHRTVVAERQHGEPAWLESAGAADRVRADWRAYRPLLDWLGEHVAEE